MPYGVVRTMLCYGADWSQCGTVLRTQHEAPKLVPTLYGVLVVERKPKRIETEKGFCFGLKDNKFAVADSYAYFIYRLAVI